MSDNILPASAVPHVERFDVPPLSSELRAPRLRVPIIAVSLYWILASIVGRIDKPYFIGFLYGLASVALLTLVVLVWWVLNRRIRLADRILGVLLVAAAGALTAMVCDPTFNVISLYLAGLPVALTAGTVWMLVTRYIPAAWRRPGTAVVVLLAWGYFALLRMEGADGDLNVTTRWRWTPTAEELFLREYAAAGSDAQSANLAAWKPALTANDWTGFRGPDRDGVLRGVRIATDWKTHPPEPRWRQRVGPAWSSLIVLDGRLFTQEQRGEKECVVCYDADNGKQLWAHEDTTRFSESVSGAGPRATPTYAYGRLYTMGGTGRLNCLDAATGKPRWSHDAAADAGAKPPMWGYSSSPLVTKGKVIVHAGGGGDKGLLAYDADSGELLWSGPAGDSSYSSPQLTTLAGKPQVLMLHDHGLTAFDPANGAILWTSGKAMSGAPRTLQPHILSTNALLISSLEGFGLDRLEVTEGNKQWKVEQAWNSRDLKPEFPDLVVHDGHAYGFDVSLFCCIDVANGKRCWKEGRYGRGQVILLPEQALLLILSETGQAVLLEASPERHKVLGRFQAINGKTWNHPVIAGGRLYARNAEEMACYDLGEAGKEGPKQ